MTLPDADLAALRSIGGASPFEFSGAKGRDALVENPLADPGDYDRRILLVTVEKAIAAVRDLTRQRDAAVRRADIAETNLSLAVDDLSRQRDEARERATALRELEADMRKQETSWMVDWWDPDRYEGGAAAQFEVSENARRNPRSGRGSTISAAIRAALVRPEPVP